MSAMTTNHAREGAGALRDRLLVWGEPGYAHRESILAGLDAATRGRTIAVLLQRGYGDLDRISAEWARARGIDVAAFTPVHWRRGRAPALFDRDRQIFALGRPTLVLAFPGEAHNFRMQGHALAFRVPVIEAASLVGAAEAAS